MLQASVLGRLVCLSLISSYIGIKFRNSTIDSDSIKALLSSVKKGAANLIYIFFFNLTEAYTSASLNFTFF